MTSMNEAKELVIKAGKKLVRSGLIARTWGNVSCRVSEDYFVITPSGRDYLSLVPDDIVPVKISDLSYSGKVKPSSEKGIHGEVYKFYPEVNFVIHTHQDYASVLSAAGLSFIPVPEGYSVLEGKVICAPYALPSTKSLSRNVGKSLSTSSAKAMILKYHGALCFGKDETETFTVASELEDACKEYIINKYMQVSDNDSFHVKEMNEFILSLHQKLNSPIPHSSEVVTYASSERTKDGFVLYPEDGVEQKVKTDQLNPSLPEEAAIYNSIFKKHKHINYIFHKKTPETLAISCSTLQLKPLLDDFAQIVGTSAKIIDNQPETITAALKKASAVFIHSRGALCTGKNKDDALAVGMVTEKSCKAYLGASLFGKPKPIHPLECYLMRFIYLNKYSKQAEKSSF
ncbi:class II aldolase/adducin family protein [Evansella tamaricis]|uniref:Class II aldolase/adducin family protein n=1 Tax=Evansella tamaricis TaxID=2069301 RepID=A0ABS6JKE0_9BACI|nr:class II aldolase/adducin family protein [Evansella tamaricis]MBU9713850.1 class II aldolase/adducin family protein [Evansella tamaricis]